MAIYLPGPPINFPPPPPTPPPPTGVIGEPNVKYSALKSKIIAKKPYCKLLTLINPTGKDVEYEFYASQVIFLGKATYKAEKIFKYKVKQGETKSIAFWSFTNLSYKHLSVSDDAGKSNVYWSLSSCTFAPGIS